MNWKRQLIETFAIFVFGGLFVMIWCTSCIQDMDKFTLNFIYSGFFWISLWKGSEYLVVLNDKVYSWIDAPIKRLIMGIVSVVIYTTFVIYSMDIIFDVFVFGKSFADAIKVTQNTSLVSTIFVTLGINAFMHGRGFLLGWRQISIDMEKLKTEQVSTRYESLKNQVNPHFLFNSLNALTSLVYEDQAKAVEFIRKLSQVYRYVLDKKDEELVSVEDETGFMENFVFLQKIRFGDNLNVEIDSQGAGGFLPPLALQILVENAIKHNVISEKDPLHIAVNITPESCTVSNNVKEKLEKDSTGIGLSNLKARYKYLSKLDISIVRTDDQFEVTLPVLKLEQ